jgi:hypothetical protein
MSRSKRIGLRLRIEAPVSSPAGQVLAWLQQEPLLEVSPALLLRRLATWTLWPAVLAAQGASEPEVQQALAMGQSQLRQFMAESLALMEQLPTESGQTAVALERPVDLEFPEALAPEEDPLALI